MEIIALLALLVGMGAVVCAGGDDDTPELAPPDDSQPIEGTDGADALSGGAGADLINGLGGDDVLVGNAGNDTLAGDTGDPAAGVKSDGNDSLLGGPGDDLMWGNGGSDVFIGGLGDDEIVDFGIAGIEDGNTSQVDGGPGDDTIFVENGSTITGGGGADQISIYTAPGDMQVTEITDFDPSEDSLAMVLEAGALRAGQVSIETLDGTSEVWLGQQLLARIVHGPGHVDVQIIEADAAFAGLSPDALALIGLRG
jgi:Ca2+-binding RTX toxin-like protein